MKLAFLALGTMACESPAQGPAPASPQPRATSGVIRTEVVAESLMNPWALAFLPDGRMLVTERPGRLRIVTANGQVSEPVMGVPHVQAQGQGGLLDVAVDPDFARNRTIFLSYAEPGEGGAGTAVARGRLTDNGRLEDVRVIYSQRPKLVGAGHFGSRIVFSRDGTLFITQGDRQSYRDSAQSLLAGQGKIVRVNPDGSIPRDNPFNGRSDAQPAIWSYGHRNVQAATLHPETGELWTVEHGARGGDELNNPQRGRNYGWPVITYGRDYSGGAIGQGITEREGMEQPVYYWDPVIAPSGMIFYTGNAFPSWRGNILVGGLTSMKLVRLVLENGRVTNEERYDIGQRVRDVAQGPDGFIYIVTDRLNGQILRVRPAEGR